MFCLLRLLDARVEAKGAWVLEGKLVGLDAFHEASKTRPKDPARAAYTAAEGYPPVEGVVARDDRTLVLRLVRPYPQLGWVLAMPYASVYPPEAVAYYGKRFMHHPVSTGPYRVASYIPAQRVVLVRNPTYRDERYPSQGEPGDEAVPGRLEDAGRPLPQNDRVVVTVFKETQPQWLYFQRGFLDRTPIPAANFASAIDAATQELRPEVAARGVVLDKDPRLDVIYDLFNMADPVVGVGERAKALRRAISLATDRDWAAEHLYNHRVTILEGVVLPDFPEHDPSFLNPWKRQPGESRADALARARRLLADAGIDPARLPPIRQDVQDDALSRQFFLAAQRDCADLGIRLEAYTSSWQEMLDRLDRGQVQTCGMAWGADYPDAQNYLMLFYGPNKPPGPNSANYQNPEYDRLYERAEVLPPGPERTELYRRLERIVVDDCPWVVRYQRRQFTLRHGWLSGYRYHDVSPRYFKYCRVDDQARRRALAERNRVAPGPVAGFALACVGLLGAMVAVARRGRRGW